MEIERRFLVPNVPDIIAGYPSYEIEQVYLSMDPAIRVRRARNRYFITVKSNTGLVREEHEMEISEEAFNRLYEKREGYVIRKRRYNVTYGKYLIEFDAFISPFVIFMAEVEFDSVEEARRFECPGWFGEEVTDNPAFSNAAIAINGRIY